MSLLTSRHPRQTVEQDHGRAGALLDRGWRYDAEVWFLDTFVMHGQIRRLRQKVLDLAGIGAGSRLLDAGCGTGTLAIEAARRAGPDARVAGIDPAPRQIARAQSKARRADLEIDFRAAVIQALPFDDQSFDAVASTLMLHHLPEDVKAEGLAEVARVLKPRGRVVIADFDTSSDEGLSDLLARAGLVRISTEHLALPRKHHGWSGITVICATKESPSR